MYENPELDGRSRPIGRRGLLLGAATLTLAACTNSSGDTGATGSLHEQIPPDTGGPASETTATRPNPTNNTTKVTACRLSPELTAGPYHLDGHLARRNITEGKPGVPLEFRVRVLDIDGCTPLPGAAVDVWHCDAGGEYSGFNGNSLAATAAGGTNDKRFLRGVQLTDEDGAARFTTIFPGWYEGRAVHIHLQVIEGGGLGTTYSGGHVAHVGQAFFDEATTAEVMGLEPYVAHTGVRTTNEADSIFAQAGRGAIVTLHNGGSTSHGYTADFTCIVDPGATPPPAPLF